jgi:hypothetical protein
LQYVSNIYKYYIAYRYMLNEFRPGREKIIQTN